MSTNTVDQPKKVTTSTVARMKQAGEKIAMITAYDYTMAQLVDAAGVDLILVGDSAANVMTGYSSTLPITLDEMIYHGKCVANGTRRAMVIVDMPFGTYQGDEHTAVRSAVRILKESGASAVKLEGGSEICGSIERILSAGAGVDGQVLVLQDMLGMNRGFRPKFLRTYASLADTIEQAVGSYVADVKSVAFPTAEESY